MKKSEMQEKFRDLLNRRKESLKSAMDKGIEGTALMYVGEICGIAASMQAIGLIDWEQEDYITNEAWAIYRRKEPEYEAC